MLFYYCEVDSLQKYNSLISVLEKDVNRTDRTIPFYAGENNPNLQILSDILMTYVMYNFDLGYVQGMSDLLSPILAVMSNEVDSFWCFVGFMNIMVRMIVHKKIVCGSPKLIYLKLVVTRCSVERKTLMSEEAPALILYLYRTGAGP